MLSVTSGKAPSDTSMDSLKLNASTKLVPRKCVTLARVVLDYMLTSACSWRCSYSDGPTKKGHLMLMTDANTNSWERRWFVLRRCVPRSSASWCAR